MFFIFLGGELSLSNCNRKLNVKNKFKVIVLLFCFISFYFLKINFKTEDNNVLVSNDLVTDSISYQNWNEDDLFLKDNANSTLDKINYIASLDPRFKIVLENYEKYPESLLQMLIRNNDMSEFVLDYLKYEGKSFADTIGKVEKDEVPLLLQYDKRWGYAFYGEHVIAINGCGPTSLAMVASYLTGNVKNTPAVIADYAFSHGYYSDVGTSWDLFTTGALKFGIKGKVIPFSKESVFKELESGRPIICSMRKGDFTTTGHFIVLVGVKDGKIQVNDSNSQKRSAKLWDYETLEYQIKNLWAFTIA